jgi:hypothetical protein
LRYINTSSRNSPEQVKRIVHGQGGYKEGVVEGVAEGVAGDRLRLFRLSRPISFLFLFPFQLLEGVQLFHGVQTGSNHLLPAGVEKVFLLLQAKDFRYYFLLLSI